MVTTPWGPEDDPNHARPAGRGGTLLIGAAAVVAVVAAWVLGANGVRFPPPPSAGGGSPTTVAPGPVLPSPEDADSWIDYVSSEGSGRLIVTGHRRDGDVTVVSVAITAGQGRQSFSFAAFDADGNYYRPAAPDTPEPALLTGEVAPGETISGNVAFRLPEGALTLVLSNDQLEAVAAVRVR